MLRSILMRRITFKGKAYLLVGKSDGAITTDRRFRTGAQSYAYLTPTGGVYKGLELIGTREDIEFGELFASPPYMMPPSLN